MGFLSRIFGPSTNGHAPPDPNAARVARLEQQLAEALRWDEPWGAFGNYPYSTNTPTDVPLAGAAIDPTASLTDLGTLRDLARDLARKNPFAINVLGNLQAFIVGEDGVKYTATTKDEASAALVAAVQDVIDEFRDRTIWPEWEQEYVNRRSRDGEAFVRVFSDNSGYLDVRIIEPEWVADPPQGSASDDTLVWQHGIGFDPEDKQTPVAYCVMYPGEREPEYVAAREILHLKANVDRNVARGLSDFFPVGEALHGVVDLLRRMRIGESVRASIAGFWEYGEGVTSSQVSSHISGLKDTVQPRGNAAHPITGKTENYQKFEPGTLVHAPSLKKFQPPPSSPAAAAQVSVEAACLRALAARWGMPENMISSDASNNNFASILVAGAPFARLIRLAQGYFKRRFLLIIWEAVRVAAEAGRIVVDGVAYSAAKVGELVEIQAEAPAPELANSLQDAQVDAIDMQAGVLSKQTRAMRRGLDYEQEKVNVENDPVSQPAAQPQPGMAMESRSSPYDILSLARAFLAAKRERASE